ncbi:MAG TPA: vWA domain-containing protein [Gemmatimonadaceae bacterium]|nr:vWA domain-containing protein [Gemmatimonadaceae bacterium]
MNRFRLLLAVGAAGALVGCSDSSRDLVSPRSPLTPAAPHANAITSHPADAGMISGQVTGPDSMAKGGLVAYTVSLTADTGTVPVDVVVVLDGSGSETSAGFNLAKQAIAQAPWDHYRTDLGVVLFSTGVNAQYGMNQNQSLSAIQSWVTGLHYPAGETYTLAGMQAAVQQFKNYGHPGWRKIIYLVTDGVPNPSTLQNPCSTNLSAASQLRSDLATLGVQTTVFGVGPDINSNVLGCLYNYDPSRFIPLSNFSVLGNSLSSTLSSLERAHDVSYTATVPAGFTVEGNPQVDAGTASVANNVITWSLGTPDPFVAHQLTFALRADNSVCGTVTSVANSKISYVFEDSVPDVWALGDVRVSTAACDQTPPVITPTISGTAGANGWYTSDVTVHWAVSDPETGVASSAGCDDAALTQDSNGTTYICSATNGAGLVAADTITIKRDTVKPTVTAAVTGTKGGDGWYTSDVTVSWVTTYGVSGAGTSTGCTTSTLTTDTNGTPFTCTTSSAAGLTASASVTVKRDQTPPAISFAGDAGTYQLDEHVHIVCQATDAGSGIDDAHTSCPSASGDVETFGLAPHTLSASAADLAGNSSTATATFQYTVTCDGVAGLLSRWTDRPLGNSLNAKLDKICRSAGNAHGPPKQAMITAMANEIRAQSGKAITPARAALLIEMIQAL